MALLVVGCLIWLPALFLVSVVRGPWFLGAELLGAIGPVVGLSVPAIWALFRGRSAPGWLPVVAFAPLLVVIGSLSMFVVKNFMYGNVHDPAAHTTVPLVTLAGWFCLGVLLTLSDGLGDEREAETTQPATNPPEVDVDPTVIDQLIRQLQEKGYEVRATSPRSWVVTNSVRAIECYFLSAEDFIEWALVNVEG